jgi:tRNA dimethylallyltransferase
MVYKGCDIGSAKPDKHILEKYPHEMIDVMSPNKVFSVADFCRDSHEIIKNTHLAKKIPLFVGGSMMYFKSLLDGMHELPDRDENYRIDLELLKQQNRPNYLYDLLKKKDPEHAKTINENDEVRIIRALEVIKLHKKPLSKILKKPAKNLLSKKIFNFSIWNFA